MAEIKKRPEKMPYNNQRIKYKHYGKTMEQFIAKIDSIEDEKTRNEFISLLANHMKKSFVMWNNDSVENKQIIKDIQHLSPIPIDHKIELKETKDFTPRRRPIKRNDKNPKFIKRNSKH